MTGSEDKPEDYDVYRDSLIRYFGYANEVGEAFRAQVHVNWVRASYGVASIYVVCDAVDKAIIASKVPGDKPDIRRLRIFSSGIDTLIWQGLASVIIPGITINRFCWLTNLTLKRSAAGGFSPVTRHWIVTGLGLAFIPFIVKPIDHTVDWGMDRTLRPYLRKLCDQ